MIRVVLDSFVMAESGDAAERFIAAMRLVPFANRFLDDPRQLRDFRALRLVRLPGWERHPRALEIMAEVEMGNGALALTNIGERTMRRRGLG